MRRDIEAFLWAVVFALIGITIALVVAHHWRAEERCHERGGLVEHFHGGWRCAEPRDVGPAR